LITITPWFVVNVAVGVPSCVARVGGVPTDFAAVPPGEYAQLIVPPTVVGVVAARLFALAHAVKPITHAVPASTRMKREYGYKNIYSPVHARAAPVDRP
jgi:hypothetical protein